MFLTSDMDVLYFYYGSKPCAESLEAWVLPYMDLTILFEGQMVYYYNDQKICLNPGEAILFPPGSKRMRENVPNPVRYVSFNVYFKDGFQPELCGHLRNCLSNDTQSILELFQSEWDTPSDHAGVRKACLVSLLYHQMVDTVHNSLNPYIPAIKEYIQHHLSEKIDLCELSTTVGLTPEYTCTLFKKYTGMTITEFTNTQRIKIARRLIKTNTYALEKIARDVGIPDYNYFARLFKKLVGLSPLQYRRSRLAQMMEQGVQVNTHT